MASTTSRSCPLSRSLARWTAASLLLCTLLGFAGCDKLSNPFRRAPLPDMGPRMPNSVKLTFDPSFTNLKMHHIDSCNSQHELPVRAEAESALIEAASQNFQAVSVTGGTASPTPPDTEILVSLQRSGLKLLSDKVYDRAPADMTLEALLTFKVAAGKELGQQTISIVHNKRLILEPTQRRSDYGNINEFVYDAGVALSTQFIRASRAQLTVGATAPAAMAAAAPERPVQSPASAPSRTVSSALSFKATMLDENGILIFECGERIRVRVDLVNAGNQEFTNVTANLTGTPSLLAQFPTTTLSPVDSSRANRVRSNLSRRSRRLRSSRKPGFRSRSSIR